MCLGNQSEKKSPPASRVVRRGKTVDINPLLATLARRVSHLAGDTVGYHPPILPVIANTALHNTAAVDPAILDQVCPKGIEWWIPFRDVHLFELVTRQTHS